MRRLLMLVLALAVCGASAVPASASQLIDRNPSSVRLAVDTKGEALLTYRAHGRLQHILAWGAINARQPASGLPQERFQKDYAGGWGKYHTLYWKTFRDSCRPYDGPTLAFLVTACKASDGSYWAVQSWQAPLPDLGMTPWLPVQRAWELHLAHWTGPIAQLDVWTDWIYSGRFHDLFGNLTYVGQPVYGFGTTRVGAPTDGYGRLIYLDTYDSRYGQGWRRENSFVSHNPSGMFCYGFYQFDPTRGYPHPADYPKGQMRGPGNGAKYRLTVEGPGVTPDVSVTVAGLHEYDRSNPLDLAYERQQNTLLDSIVGVDKLCRQH